MGLSVAVQMDPIERINIDADSTFRIMEEAQARGHRLFYYTPDRLALDQGRVIARGWPVEVRRAKGDHFTLGPEAEIDLAEKDVVWLRQDPPFDMGYITTTHILERLQPGTLVVNDPFWVRNYPEKLLVLGFPDLTPPTTVARDLATLKAFKARHGDIILKPLYGNGGAGVFRLDPNDRNFNALYELFAGINREPLIAQKFLPDVAQGDKRIILVDGEAVGGINRVPPEGETRSNLHIGGKAEKLVLTDRDRDICAAIGPLLRDEGAGLRRHRRDRRLADRDQRHLADRPAGARALRRGERDRADLGSDRASPRRMSWQLAGLNLWLRMVEKPYLARETDFARARARLERQAPYLAPPPGARLKAEALGGLPALRMDAPEGAPTLLWLHGGAYCLGSPRTHAGMAAALALRAGAGLALPDYRLAPEHPLPGRGRGRARRLGRAARRGPRSGAPGARRRQRRGRARLRAPAHADRGRAAAAGRGDRLQPLGRPDPVRREPAQRSPGATCCCRRRASPRSATSTSPAPTRATRAPRRASAASWARRRC